MCRKITRVAKTNKLNYFYQNAQYVMNKLRFIKKERPIVLLSGLRIKTLLIKIALLGNMFFQTRKHIIENLT